ncbi:MAG: hypothetical protein IKP50_00205 [Bacilli bacterium]|nr:hypothetical protein [Bacilli bacterium]
MSAEDIGDYKEFPTKESALDWLDNYLSLDERNNLIRVLEQEPKTGHWIDTNNHQYYNDGDIETTELKCSCCNEEVEWDIELLHKPFFCENCGAKMVEPQESEVENGNDD